MATVPAVPREKMLPAPITALVQGIMPDLKKLLPPDIEYEKFRAGLWLELTGRTSLKDCSLPSIRAAAVKAATYGLLPGRDCDFLPFAKEAQCITTYFGLIRSLERTGKLARAFAHPVYEGDEFVMDYFANEYRHVPYMVRRKPPGNILFYYGAIKQKDGTVHVEPMSLEQIEAVRRQSPAKDKGPWVTHKVEMSRKTALKHVAKYVQLTEEQQALLDQEEQVLADAALPERARQAATDLFDNDVIDLAPTRTPDRLWMDTLRAHWQEAPDELRPTLEAIVKGEHQVSESEGFALQEELLRYLDTQWRDAEEG